MGNELTVFTFNDVDVIDSRQVAEMVGKEHKNLLRDISGYIETMAKSDKISQLKIEPSDFFIESTFENRGKRYPCYLLTKKGCDMVANKMTGDKGVLFTAAYVSAFDEMQKKIPKDLPTALRAYANQLELNQKLLAEVQNQQKLIESFEPIKQYVDTILESKDSLAVTQIAKDYGMSAKQLNKILTEEGIQYKVNKQWVLYSKYAGKGYTDSKTYSFMHSNGETGTRVGTCWTQKGRLLIHELLQRRGIEALMDRRDT